MYITTVTRDQRGMTLLEIMLALLILGTVVTMVSVTLSGSLKVLNATQDQGEIYHRAQVALLRISEDLASTVLDDVEDFVGLDEQDTDSLQFTSTAHIVFNKAADTPGIALISYRVEEDPENEGDLVLIRSDDLLVTAAGKSNAGAAEGGFMLADRLRSVNFRYIDEQGEEVDAWTTSKNALTNPADRKLPVAVSCILAFWLDRENDSSLEFSTRILLPTGLINKP